MLIIVHVLDTTMVVSSKNMMTMHLRCIGWVLQDKGYLYHLKISSNGLVSAKQLSQTSLTVFEAMA